MRLVGQKKVDFERNETVARAQMGSAAGGPRLAYQASTVRREYLLYPENSLFVTIHWFHLKIFFEGANEERNDQ